MKYFYFLKWVYNKYSKSILIITVFFTWLSMSFIFGNYVLVVGLSLIIGLVIYILLYILIKIFLVECIKELYKEYQNEKTQLLSTLGKK